MYNPERDIAHISRTLMYAAISHLEQNRWSPELAELFAQHDISPLVIGELVHSFADAQNRYVGVGAVATPGEALMETGFFAKPFVARQALMAAIGEVLVGAYFRAVRDVTHIGELPPREIADFVAAGRSVARQLSGASAIPPEMLEADLTHLRSVVLQLQADKQSLQAELQACRRNAAQEAAMRRDTVACPSPATPPTSS
jgi:hypothetical protein